MATDDKVSVILTSTNTNGAVKQKSFTYISPEATNGQLKAFAQAANSLTENTYNGSRKVTQVDLDTADPGGGKQTATITLTTASMSLADLKTALTGGTHFKYINGISYNGDGKLYCFISPDSANPSSYVAVTNVYGTDNTNKMFGFMTGSDDIVNSITAPFDVTIRADETDNYKAAEATFTVTA